MSKIAPLPSYAVRVPCPSCGHLIACYDPAHSRYFGCPKCHSYFSAQPQTGEVGRVIRTFQSGERPAAVLQVGTVAELGGYRCRITAYQVRNEQADARARWGEYQLRPAEPLPGGEPDDFPLQLAEYQGHWLLIRRALTHPAAHTGEWPAAVSYDPHTDRTYRLWHRYRPHVCGARGEFDWNILEDEHLHIQEMTCPPYLLASEQRGTDTPAWYLAEHLEPLQVSEAFGVTRLHQRQGVGAAQPGPAPHWPQLRRLAGAMLGLLVVLQVLLALVLRRPTDFNQTFNIPATAAPATTAETTLGSTSDPATATASAPAIPPAYSQMLVSQNLTLANSSLLKITFTTPDLLNHWVEVTGSLVNEENGRGYEFSKSLEFYEGVEDGEHWTEGDRSASVLLHDIPAGRYHLNLYPSAEAGAGSTDLRMELESNSVPWSNFWLLLALLSIVPIWKWYGQRQFEVERWENSDFGPSS